MVEKTGVTKEIDKSVIDQKKPHNEQMYSAMSFAVMLIVIGIPLWWKTTEVYRVSLPYNEIELLTDDSFQISLNVHVATIEKERGGKIAEELLNLFRSSRVYNASIKQHIVPKALLGSYKTIADYENKVTHPRFEGSIQLMEVPGLLRFTEQKVLVGENRTIYFSSESDASLLYNILQTRILAEDHLKRTVMHVHAPPLGQLDAECSRRVSPAAAFDVLVTVLHPDPHLSNLVLDMPKAIDEYLGQLLRELSDLNTFHVKSQWLFLINLQVTPKPIVDQFPHFALPESSLVQVITPLEKKLASHVSKNPCLNLVLWVPTCATVPIHIYSDKGHRIKGRDAFLSPRWGGIQIYNPPSDQCEVNINRTIKPDPKVFMPVFVEQIRLLLGVSSLQSDAELGHVTTSTVPLRSWEKDYLLRSRTIEHLTIAKHTLKSLSKLLGEINNIVINDHIGDAIYGSLTSIKFCEESLSAGKLLEAYKHSQKAFLSSEAAFSDPSLLALLYFPEDQKYAVYIPLFLPVMIPVIISFRPLRIWFLSQFKVFTKEKND